jgi:holo-[acyl-carrier protein] synthase
LTIPDIYIGVDLVDIERVKEAFLKFGSRFLEKLFNEEELHYYTPKRLLEGVATLFASKEAVKKLYLQKDINPGWKDIFILHDHKRKIAVKISSKVPPVFEKICLSVTHTPKEVCAVALGFCFEEAKAKNASGDF